MLIFGQHYDKKKTKQNLDHERKMEEQNRRDELIKCQEEAYSRLLGQEFLIVELLSLHVFYYTLVQSFNYHAMQTKDKTEKLYRLELLKYHQEKATELKLEIAKSKRDLFVIIGSIQTLFKKTQILDEMIIKIQEALNNYNNVLATGLPANLNGEGIAQWAVEKQSTEFVKFCIDELEPSLDNLLDYIKSEIDKNIKDSKS